MGNGNTNVVSMPTPEITTNGRIGDHLRQSLRLRGVPAGETFGDFVKACRDAGVHDDMLLESIEYGVMQHGTGRISVEIGEVGIAISEVRPSEVGR